MSTSGLDEKLTPAAKKTLYEILEDYRQQVLVAAAANASMTTGEVREISVHDIVRGVQKSFGSHREKSRTAVERLTVTYVALGLVISIAGFAIFALQNLRTIEFERQLPLLVGFIGAVVALAGFVLFYYSRRRALLTEREGYMRIGTSGELVGKYLIVWREIEVALRSLASTKLGESVAQEPISFLVNRLAREKVLQPEAAEQLQNLLTIRNQIAHGQRPVQQSELLASLNQAHELWITLERYRTEA